MKIIFAIIFLFAGFAASAQTKQIWEPQNKFDSSLLRKFNIEGGKPIRAYQVRQLWMHKADNLFGYTERWVPIRVFLNARKERISEKLSDHIDPEPIR